MGYFRVTLSGVIKLIFFKYNKTFFSTIFSMFDQETNYLSIIL